ncbi:ribonuclease P protein component [Dysgonomonas sp. Marseille-P4361]|uniref:ribonuclease P protein component n=1 Tax=Dysgonomonas sp. Marseille-P4361 TaxID=2161820 RepID=UPI000D55BDD9|nr:ribonuclease P protein component [Dysgonomonas sp. Marseille-P4361]
MEIDNISKAKNTFSKFERLHKNKSIDRLFQKGDSFVSYPLRIVYYAENMSDDKEKAECSILVSVSKKKFKRAVKRNRVKRLIREAYRLNKISFLDSLKGENRRVDIAFLYLKSELPVYEEIEKAMLKAMTTLSDKLKEDKLE